LVAVWWAAGRLSGRAQRQELGGDPALEGRRDPEDAPLLPGAAGRITWERRPVARASGVP
jgi:hypothetical protein